MANTTNNGAIFYAITIDGFRRSISLQSCLCAMGILFPALMGGLMNSAGVAANEKEVSELFVRLMHMNVFYCSFVAIEFLTVRPRLFTLPISTAKLAAFQLIPAMVNVWLSVVLVTGIDSYLFSQQFPLWGPAFYAATATAVIWAVFWYTNGSWRQFVALPLATVLMLSWYGFRFRKVASGDADFSAFEFLLLGGVSLVAYCFAVVALSRRRCGDGMPTPEISIRHWLGASRTTDTRFRSPLAAQVWYEQKKRFWYMPHIFSLILVGVFFVWMIESLEPRELLKFLVGTGGGLIAVGLTMGIYYGVSNPDSSSKSREPQFPLGSFLASRPLTDRDLSNILLKLQFRSVLLSWSVWVVSLLLTAFGLWLIGYQPLALLPPKMMWWWVPAILVGAWSATSLAAALMLMNDIKRLFLVNGVFISVGMVYGYLSFRMGLLGQKSSLDDAVSMVLGVAFLIVVAAFFYVAFQREKISKSTLSICLAVWSVMGAAILYERFRVPTDSISFSVFASGIAAVSMLPFAATPLAVSHNRHC